MAEEPQHRSTNHPWALTMQSLVDGARAAVDVQRRLVRAALPSDSEASAGDWSLPRQVERYWQGVAQATAAYYQALARIATDYGDRVDRGRASGAPSRGDDVAHPTIRLRGRVGTTLAATFTLENTDPDPADVAVTVGACRSERGEGFSAPVTVEPVTATVAPGETLSVTVRITLDPDVFDPDTRYTFPLRVEGPRPTTVDVRIRTDAAPSEPAGPRADTQYAVRCPRCGRTFDRKTDDLRLRPHKTPEGQDCPEREGRRAPTGHA